MLHYQKVLLEDLFNSGASFDAALVQIDAIEWREIDDARHTWQRWSTELDMWGFYAY
jgi:hypothetical protein